jgi:hypothetical protein
MSRRIEQRDDNISTNKINNKNNNKQQQQQQQQQNPQPNRQKQQQQQQQQDQEKGYFDHHLLRPNTKCTIEEVDRARDEKRTHEQIVAESPYIQTIINQHGADLHHDQSHHHQQKLKSNETADPASTINRLAGNSNRL